MMLSTMLYNIFQHKHNVKSVDDNAIFVNMCYLAIFSTRYLMWLIVNTWIYVHFVISFNLFNHTFIFTLSPCCTFKLYVYTLTVLFIHTKYLYKVKIILIINIKHKFGWIHFCHILKYIINTSKYIIFFEVFIWFKLFYEYTKLY